MCQLSFGDVDLLLLLHLMYKYDTQQEAFVQTRTQMSMEEVVELTGMDQDILEPIMKAYWTEGLQAAYILKNKPKWEN